MRRLAMLTLAVTTLFLGAGCMTAAKRVFKEAKGASSDATTVPGSATQNFARFHSVNVESPKTELGSLVPAEFNSHLVTNIRKELTQGKEPLFAGGSPALTIEPHVMWFNKGNPVLPHRYAVVLFYLRGEGADLGRVQIVTKSEATRTGADDLAEDMAAELRKYFSKHGKGRAGDKADDND